MNSRESIVLTLMVSMLGSGYYTWVSIDARGLLYNSDADCYGYILGPWFEPEGYESSSFRLWWFWFMALVEVTALK